MLPQEQSRLVHQDLNGVNAHTTLHDFLDEFHLRSAVANMIK